MLEFYSCEEMEVEIESTLNKQRLQKYLDKDLINNFWVLFHAIARKAPVTSIVDICRDPKDNFLLALAKDVKADFLITGDRDLLDIGRFESTIICTLTEFVEKYLKKS